MKKNLGEVLSVLFAKEGLTWESKYIEHFPKKYTRHGDLLMLPSSMLDRSFFKDIDQTKFLRCIADAFKVKRIAVEEKIFSDGMRTPNVKLVFGSDGFVTHVDNKIRYSFDVTKCMFSSGNISEKIRMAKLNCKNEIVVDMFAGIGYFTLPLLVHALAKLLYACEWNPNAIKALNYNLKDNKVADKCIVLEGDNRKVTPIGVANRVILGLIPSAADSYEAACKALNPTSGGILHIHGNVSSKEKDHDDFKKIFLNYNIDQISCNRKLKPEWLAWAIETAQSITNILNDLKCPSAWQANISHIERVKSYAPHIDHLVLDLIAVPRMVT